MVHHATGAFGGLLGWLVNTTASAIIGLIVGSVVMAIISVLPIGKKEHHADEV